MGILVAIKRGVQLEWRINPDSTSYDLNTKELTATSEKDRDYSDVYFKVIARCCQNI